MMRVVYLLSASMPGVMPLLKWVPRADGGLDLVLPKALAHLDGERPAGRMAQLAKVMGRDLALKVEA